MENAPVLPESNTLSLASRERLLYQERAPICVARVRIHLALWRKQASSIIVEYISFSHSLGSQAFRLEVFLRLPGLCNVMLLGPVEG